MSVNNLNSSFAIGEQLTFDTGINDWPRAKLRHDSGNMVEVYLYGAHISRFQNPKHGEILYVSSTAEFTKGKAIRGGVPIIFPQFGPGAIPSHGFARNNDWLVIASSLTPQKEVSLTLGLSATAETKKIWPYDFRCEFEIRLSAGLTTALRVENTGDVAFPFQCALHTYFTVSSIEKVTISDLSGLAYLDTADGRAKKSEPSNALDFSGEVDRVYLNTPSQLSIDDAGLKRSILIRKQGLPDAVVWNPWIEKGKSLKDLEPDGYRKFVCVEAGSIEPAITLAPGKHFEGTQEIWVKPLP